MLCSKVPNPLVSLDFKAIEAQCRAITAEMGQYCTPNREYSIGREIIMLLNWSFYLLLMRVRVSPLTIVCIVVRVRVRVQAVNFLDTGSSELAL